MSNSKYVYSMIIAAAISSLILIGLTNVYAATEKSRAKLDGNNEIPPTTSQAEATINLKTNSEGDFVWKMNITGITEPTGIHLHQGTSVENGDVIVNLLENSKSTEQPTGIFLRGNITKDILEGSMQGKTIDDLKTAISSGNVYANVHTDAFPDGEIRGQLKMKGADESPDTMSTDTAESAGIQ